jgi:hypothetical protein
MAYPARRRSCVSGLSPIPLDRPRRGFLRLISLDDNLGVLKALASDQSEQLRRVWGRKADAAMRGWPPKLPGGVAAMDGMAAMCEED